MNFAKITLKGLACTDCVKDRLAAFFHWGDIQSLKQAVLVAESNKIDRKNLKHWAKTEGFAEKLEQFLKLLSH